MQWGELQSEGVFEKPHIEQEWLTTPIEIQNQKIIAMEPAFLNQLPPVDSPTGF